LLRIPLGASHKTALKGRRVELVQLKGVLETILYYSSGEEEELARFYGDVLGLQAVGRGGLTFRVGPGLLLLFDRDRSVLQSKPPPHGAAGAIHTCFVAAPEDYESWRSRLTDNAVPIVEEIEWDNGVRSFYFHDPAGNVLEIADGDLWPKA
jgi:catechol 2,3-dioxygenase-like lactoylglutathione lyase family enzyme